MTNPCAWGVTDSPEPTDRDRERQAITDDVAMLCGRISGCPSGTIATADLWRIRVRLERVVKDFQIGVLR